MGIFELYVGIIAVELEEMKKIHLYKQRETLLLGRSFFK